MRFFNVKNPINISKYDVIFIKIENILGSIIYYTGNKVFFKNLFLIIKNVLKSKIIKDKIRTQYLLKSLSKGVKKLLVIYKKNGRFRILNKFYLKKNRRRFLNHFKEEKVLKLETKRSLFKKRILKNKIKFLLFYDYLIYRYKKSFKKKILYFKKKKEYNLSFLKTKIASYYALKKRRRKRFIKPQYLHFFLRNKKKKYLAKQQKIDYVNKVIETISKSRRKFRRVLRKRKKQFRRKYLLIKKYKKLKLRRKKKIRTGILHFRSYYSNYYVTLTDLSFNVICSFSAGSVSESNNKKTKMSKVVAMPIFFRVLQFLRAYKIKGLKVVIRNRMDKMFYTALDFFKKNGYKFRSFSFANRKAHHLGQRTKKPRRI
jgi:ribosomal protein S11